MAASFGQILSPIQRRRLHRGIAAALLALFTGSAAAEEAGTDKSPARTDALGDPLPPRAIARLGTGRLRGCSGPIVFSPDGKYLVAAGGDGGVQAVFWDAGTGRRVRTLTAKATIMQLVFSPDGKQLAAAVNGGNFCPVWETATGKQRFTFTAQSVAFSADGKKLITTYGLPKPTVRSYDTNDGKQQSEWTLDFSCTDNVTLSADGRFVAVPEAGEPRIRIFDVRKKAEVKTLHFHRWATNFTLYGRRLVGYGKSGWTVWDWAAGKSLDLVWRGSVHDVPAFSPDGKRLAWIGADDDRPGRVSLWVIDLDGGKPRRLGVTATTAGRHPPVFSNDGKKLAVVTEGDAAIIVDSRTGRDLLPLSAHTRPIVRVAYFAEGRYLLTGDSLRLLVWEAASGRLLRRLPDDLPEGETILLNTLSHGRIITVTLADGTLHLRDAATTKELRRLDGKDVYAATAKERLGGEDGFVFGGPLHFSAVSHDGRSAAIVGPAGIRIYDLDTGAIRCQFARDHPVWGMEFSGNGRTLEVTNLDLRRGLLFLFYDARTGRKVESGLWKGRDGRWGNDHKKAKSRLRELKLLDADGRPAFAFAEGFVSDVYELSDGRYLAVKYLIGHSREHGLVRIWDTLTRWPVLELDRKQQLSGFAPDGRTLISTESSAGTIHLWEVGTGRERLRLAGHMPGDVSIGFRSDGRVLVSGGDDTQVFLWDLTGRSPDGVRHETQHSPQRVEELGQTLAGDDAAKAYRAMWALVDAPSQTVGWMRQHLAPVAPVERRELKRLLGDLDSNEFAIRNKASEELERLGELAEPALRDALAAKPTLECRRRCEDLLAKLAVLSSWRLRAVRAVEVLEQIGTAEARTLLEKWSQGATKARQTQEAKAALQRFPKGGGNESPAQAP